MLMMASFHLADRSAELPVNSLDMTFVGDNSMISCKPIKKKEMKLVK